VFTNRTDDSTLVSLATHDTHGVSNMPKILSIRDAFADFASLDRHLFIAPSPYLNSGPPPPPPAVGARLGPWKRALAESATAVVAALRCSPIIRYQRGSERAAELARAAADLLTVRSVPKQYFPPSVQTYTLMLRFKRGRKCGCK
jgi:hypothetical protein